MRLDRLDLTRYGRFTGTTLRFAAPPAGSPDLHIVYGPNEAGKSTLFSAWLDLLFGIPSRSPYVFRHDGPTMLIGAGLTDAGATREVRRVKKTRDSLLDGHDSPIPEATLQAMLGGLGRENYNSMFSLDKSTMERGGESILASRGDLGEMLFSASAGLSQLTPRLEALRADLDSFHRSGKRTGWLVEAKKQLGALQQDENALNVSANQLRKWARDAADAEAEWRDARAAEDGVQAELNRLVQVQGTLPLLDRRARLADLLAPINHLPDADAATQKDCARIEAERADLNTRIAVRTARLASLDAQLTSLATDPDVLAIAEDITAAEALRAGHDTAMADLPRRRDEADRVRAQIAVLLSDLDRAGASAADVVLAEPVIVRLRALLAARSGLLTADKAAAAETAKAKALLAREREQSGDPQPDHDDAALPALLTRLRTQDPVDARARALRDRDEAQGRLSAALGGLAPWIGDAAGLAALAVPPGWQMQAWEDEAEAARQQAQDIGREVDALQDRLDRMDGEVAGQGASTAAGGMTLADAAAARSLREALWAAHRSNLTEGSADRFEQALREDDRISAQLAEAIAEARRSALHGAERDRLAAQLTEARARRDAAAARGVRVDAAVSAACDALGLTGAGLADLKSWLDLRVIALTHHHAVRDAQAALDRAGALLDAQTTVLSRALGQDGAAGGYEALLALATARLAAADQRREARRRLNALAADLREREEAGRAAQQDWAAWQLDWAGACRGSVLADYRDDDPSLGAMLDRLDQLGLAVRELAQLDDRIEKMAANQRRFQQARAGVLQSLSLPEGTPWPEVLSRLRRAEDAARDHTGLSGTRALELRQDAEDRSILAVRAAAAAEMGARLGQPDGVILADHIARCVEATRLRREIATLEDELRGRPQPEAAQDAQAIQLRIDTLKAEAQLLREATEARHEAHLEARRQLEKVGGDDALARVVAERQNLLLEIRERARDHLAARFGLMAFEAGMRRYRDEHRSGMMARASDAFSRLTLGAYDRLASQPDGSSEILMALPREGGAKQAKDLSDGTRFQLYLALRIAGYHELAKSRPSVPFIGDDIMETFDDQRAAAAFGLLAEMSRLGQVIYLTHHRHLLDIARAACPGVNAIELSATERFENAG